MALVLSLALSSVACTPECEVASAGRRPDPALASDRGYLDALQAAAAAADPSAGERLAAAGRDYDGFRRLRLAEIERQPYYRARPEEADWSDAVWLGRDVWFHWTAGNQYMWRDLAQRSRGHLELLRLIDNRQLPRGERFERFGLITDPAARPPASAAGGGCVPDQHGLCLDRIDDPGVSETTAERIGRPTGIMGLRLFDNPDYSAESWDPERPFEPVAGCEPGRRSPPAERTAASTAAESRADCYQPPYLVGVACGFCHISFDPENPPADPAAPDWDNLAGALGNVYIQEGPLFSWMLEFGEDSFYTDYLMAQPEGTSDTSRIATDDLDNPGAINGIFRLDARLAEAAAEELPNGGSERVPRVLKDGADSAGVALAALRVYVNIGMLGNEWLNRHDAYLVLGGAPRPQEPFSIRRAINTPGYDGGWWWDATEVRMGDLKSYLATGRPPSLARAPGGESFLPADDETLARGRRVFADHCAGCHSSRRPEIDRRDDPEAFRSAMRRLVDEPGFFDGNFLSDDRRYPAPVVGVNLTRSMATNALAGRVWQDFSSLDYKNLPSIGRLELPRPFPEEDAGGAGRSVAFCAPAGGRGYYRTASLAGLWATAPFFHNNALGRPVHDPAVESRVAAFEDAAEQLLWPERRTGPDGTPGPWIKRTGDHVTWLPLPDGVELPVPPNYPIKAVGNLPLHGLLEAMPALLRRELSSEPSAARRERRERIARRVLGNPVLRRLLRELILAANAAPDFVENRGHEAIVGRIETDADKRALIELMKTF